MTASNEELLALADELNLAAERLHLPPSIQSQRNIRVIDTCDKAAPSEGNAALNSNSDGITDGREGCQSALLNCSPHNSVEAGVEPGPSETQQTPATDKTVEGIARIIDPEAWSLNAWNDNWRFVKDNRQAIALIKANAILSAYPLRDEAAIRAEEREKCAKVADSVYIDAEGQMSGLSYGELYGMQMRRDAAEEIAAAIREGAK